MEVTLEFCGGAETAHNGGEKFLTFKSDHKEPKVSDIFAQVRSKKLIDDIDALIESDKDVKPGVLVLINDADWELFNEADYQVCKNDRITFVSTLHGG
ncbi:Oidioi.mRNA.OKI2018_I69.chr1.g1562.t1.cds [Oikopleura dioica]|uniref:Ubiquitin-related modifier 1 homolog n=1 Tax=Oikopleura dioica TaxID=34765 RepID=A0ABN7SQ01_OIKDI|nr:Oidioi.mRNA.OKI2018_I69.chr1.g1562.t1.cds [Oikopleura dioica]